MSFVQQPLRELKLAAVCFYSVVRGAKRSADNRWLHRFAVLTAVATLGLIGIGGLVTSHEAGLSVPDWPTSYGYNMFLFPIGQWWHGGNIFYEHSHRLFASGVGLLTTILACWLWVKEPRAWVRWLGIAAFFAVVFQGVLGGLRVVWLRDEIGIFHAALAQLFFVCTCALALFTSNWWKLHVCRGRGNESSSELTSVKLSGVQWLFLVTTAAIFVQLVLGATMRHQHAGLAISDFPLAYGKLWPATDPDSILRYNQQRVEISGINPITATQVQLQMAHRILALLVFGGVIAAAWLAVRRHTFRSAGGKLSLLWLGLILTQVGLGAATVLSHKAADIATLHVLVGALSLATGALLCLTSLALPENASASALVSEAEHAPTTFAPHTAVARS